MTTKPKARKFRIKRGAPTTVLRAAPPRMTAGGADHLVAPEPERTIPPRAPGGSADPVRLTRPVAVPPPASAAAAQAARPGAAAKPVTPSGAKPVAQPVVQPVVQPVAQPVSRAATAPAATAPAAETAQTQAQTRAEPPPPAAPMTVDEELDAIRAENLTGRQLRMARRVANKHNLSATSDIDAVRLLRKKGIDPFKLSSLLDLVVPRHGPDTAQPAPEARQTQQLPATTTPVQLPQTVPQKPRETLPSTDLSPRERRDREIAGIQRDIMLRRRRKMLLLMARLAFFVFLPTFIAGWYFYVAATPMYSTKSEFLILQADGAGASSGLGGLLAGTQFATSQDAIAVQSYLESKDAMLRLDRDAGFKAHFEQPWIDPIQRLDPGATNEQAYRIYKKNVKIGFDPTEGVIRMEVSAADPEVSAEFSRKLISYAEDRVNNLSEKKRDDQMRDARISFEKAETDRRDAQEKLVNLQQQGALLDPEGVIASLRSQISNVEVQLQERQLDLAALLDNARPNQAKVDGARGDIGRLQDLRDALNKKMTDASQGENSLAQLTARIQMAQADLATREMMLQSALQQVETTRMEANRQVRYLTTSVAPVASEEPSYPRSFEDTILAFLIFSGIYLMISLTASILREQVTS
ncbi:MAG: capsule biosynthesis protein [Rhodobacteraceae bacterium]|nr:capsule biosynthesis protein [Paracoccaceae bacterium]MAY45557.1 capsule biosynthesis protein [Paracoccaceae bacterium]